MDEQTPSTEETAPVVVEGETPAAPADTPTTTAPAPPAPEESEPVVSCSDPELPGVYGMTQVWLNQHYRNFYLVVSPDNAWPCVEHYNTVAELRGAIRRRLGQPLHMFAFVGESMKIFRRGAYWYIKTPVGELPITNPEQEYEADDGWVGDKPKDALSAVPGPDVQPAPASPQKATDGNSTADSPVFEDPEEENEE